jgi:hypothetical protein
MGRSYNAVSIAIMVVAVLFVVAVARRTSRAQVAAGHREWNVLADFDNRAEAAARLSRVHSRMIEFMRVLRQKYHVDEPDDIIAAEGATHSAAISASNDVHQIISHLLDNYNPDVFYENDPRTSTDTSYTVNKGAAMYLCLRSKTAPYALVDEETLVFVLLHEMAHCANYRGWGHGKDFWEVFKLLLHEARLARIHTPVDYSKTPVLYCGLPIEWNPYYDPAIRSLWL